MSQQQQQKWVTQIWADQKNVSWRGKTRATNKNMESVLSLNAGPISTGAKQWGAKECRSSSKTEYMSLSAGCWAVNIQCIRHQENGRED